MTTGDSIIKAFADTFLGYGDYEAPYWFVGMEEGGGGSVAEIKTRLRTWATRGEREVEDLPAYSCLVGVGHWFDDRPPVQPTWGKLIRAVLSAEGRSASLEDVRRFQRDELGRPGGSTALLELMPLPSPSTSHWLYAEYTALAQFADRAAYRAHYAARRAAQLRQRVEKHCPRAVVFYGKEYLYWWEQIAGVPLLEVPGLGMRRAERGGTTFLVATHPAAMGVTNAYFESVGRATRRTSTTGSTHAQP